MLNTPAMASQQASAKQPKKRKKAHERLTLISLFSGGGGLDLGLEAAGFETVFAGDIDHHSCETLRMGKIAARAKALPFLQKATILQEDVRNLTSGAVLSASGTKPGETALLAGGPPCQAFSVFGKRKGKQDPRGLLAYEYLRLVAEIEPRAFVFENVFGLLTIEGGEIFKELVSKLENPGGGAKYTLTILRLNAADYGVPQYRDRIFIVGSREGLRLTGIPRICDASKAGEPLFEGRLLLRPRTVEDAFRGLPPIGAPLPNHTGREHSERIISRYRNLALGERDSKTRINKLDPCKPSFTIIVGSDKGGGKGHVHPVEPREVTPRESARIQTFPDWWAFSGTSRHPIRQVGNAVPPILGAMVGREIASQFFGAPRRSLRAIADILGQSHLFQEAIDEI